MQLNPWWRLKTWFKSCVCTLSSVNHPQKHQNHSRTIFLWTHCSVLGISGTQAHHEVMPALHHGLWKTSVSLNQTNTLWISVLVRRRCCDRAVRTCSFGPTSFTLSSSHGNKCTPEKWGAGNRGAWTRIAWRNRKLEERRQREADERKIVTPANIRRGRGNKFEGGRRKRCIKTRGRVSDMSDVNHRTQRQHQLMPVYTRLTIVTTKKSYTCWEISMHSNQRGALQKLDLQKVKITLFQEKLSYFLSCKKNNLMNKVFKQQNYPGLRNVSFFLK